MTSHAGKWAYSYDEETYRGMYDSREEALADADKKMTVWTGQYRDPTPPEEYIDADEIFDAILCQDEYCGDWADGTFDCSKEEKDELEAALRRAFVDWMDRHGMRPSFGVIEPETINKFVPQNAG